MGDLVYDKEKLIEATRLLLDQRYGKLRSDVVRGNVNATKPTLSWFNGGRKPLKVFLEIAKQPGGRLAMLDLLDTIDRNRETTAKEQQESAPAAAEKVRQQIADAKRRNRIRESAALLTEMIRREERGEPPLTTEGQEAFLNKRRAYWSRRTEEYLEQAKLKPEIKHIGTLRAEIANILLTEELGRYRQAKAGVYKLSSASQRRLNNPRDKRMWARADTAMAAAFKEASQK